MVLDSENRIILWKILGILFYFSLLFSFLAENIFVFFTIFIYPLVWMPRKSKTKKERVKGFGILICLIKSSIVCQVQTVCYVFGGSGKRNHINPWISLIFPHFPGSQTVGLCGKNGGRGFWSYIPC